MSKLKSEINQAAHYLAQVNEIQIRYVLAAKCQALLKEGKPPDDIARFLKQVVSGGMNGLDTLMGRTS